MKYGCILLILLGMVSCNSTQQLSKKNSEIQSITMRIWGGMTGTNDIRIFTPQSLRYDFSMIVDPSQNQQGEARLTQEDWQNILELIHLEEFEKIQNGSSHQVYDGVDTEIKISTPERDYSVVNGEGNPYWDALKAELEKQYDSKKKTNSNSSNMRTLKLGAFSVSLAVKDLKTSQEFYEKLGFHVMGGSMEKNYLIMKNETTLIGLFQGMFEGNILTFNPGWDENANNLEDFDDVREIQKHLKSNQISLLNEADESTSGPAYIMLQDPDGNMILIDQHR